MIWAFPHQSLINKMSHRLAYRPIWWRQFLSWGSLFLSVPCWQQRLTITHTALNNIQITFFWFLHLYLYLIIVVHVSVWACVIVSKCRVGRQLLIACSLISSCIWKTLVGPSCWSLSCFFRGWDESSSLLIVMPVYARFSSLQIDWLITSDLTNISELQRHKTQITWKLAKLNTVM